MFISIRPININLYNFGFCYLHAIITPENVNTIDESRSKIVRNIVFDCHLSPKWRQMAIENTVPNYF